ncbi:MAG: hypothetical protein IPJ19_11955 [Planctomycetes bacterium]|nr:hypothetical protein [Planctomycetota bacterium]
MNDLRPEDWDRLRELRSAFLERGETTTGDALSDYWGSERDLELYDATFARRIGWRWAAVLDELESRAFPRAPAVILDWGCGTGGAARAWLEHFGADGLTDLHLVDRSLPAAQFAAERVRPLAGSARIHEELPATCDLLLLSHVLDETGSADRTELLELCSRAHSIVWLEPGHQASARALVTLREELRTRFDVIAPCPHRDTCGLLAPGHERDWCHHFATPPRSVFQDGFWTRASRELGIDLRSLPYSFLALATAQPDTTPADVGRVLGRPRMEKGRARLDLCTRTGVQTRDYLARFDKQRFRELGESPERARLFRVREEGERIVGLDPFP